jgi:hypothetical protein
MRPRKDATAQLPPQPRPSRHSPLHETNRLRGSSALEKVTVNLTSRSAEALGKTVAATGDSKTDVINKALQLYAFMQEYLDAGGRVYIRDSDSSELERLRIL